MTVDTVPQVQTEVLIPAKLKTFDLLEQRSGVKILAGLSQRRRQKAPLTQSTMSFVCSNTLFIDFWSIIVGQQG